ncbi:putative aminoacyltransferase, E1 ubiquitin-activating enzyme [Rosa chinensis]|uniref:U-box domain-containing protein n=1 Tax=Rosa chinensis TaxID=74649 RepID=A0A2P6P5B3_ROSCH|nr:putative aminoacyltransferase, E1 ubiquitin-activating enzyme [Rosa chinensis]
MFLCAGTRCSVKLLPSYQHHPERWPPTPSSRRGPNIESWVAPSNTTCPVTRTQLADFTLIPNHTLRRLIQEWYVANRSFGVVQIPTPKRLVDPTRTEQRGAHAYGNFPPRRVRQRCIDLEPPGRGVIEILQNPIAHPRALKIGIKALFVLCLVKQMRKKVVSAGAPEMLINTLADFKKCDSERALATIESSSAKSRRSLAQSH